MADNARSKEKWKFNDGDYLPEVDLENLFRSLQTSQQRNSNGYPHVSGTLW